MHKTPFRGWRHVSQHPSSYVSNVAVYDSGCRVNAGCWRSAQRWTSSFISCVFKLCSARRKSVLFSAERKQLFCQKLGFILILTEESTCMNTLVLRNIVVRKTVTSPERLQEPSVRDHRGEKTAFKTRLERKDLMLCHQV